jgi:hypothetical protein
MIGPAGHAAPGTKSIGFTPRRPGRKINPDRRIDHVSWLWGVEIRGEELSLTLWTHEATRLRQAWDTYGHAVWKPRWHVLSLPGPSGVTFNMATWDRRTPCVEKVAPPPELQTTVDRVLWEARTYGGYTVPLSSLRPGDEVEIAKALRRDEMKFRHLGSGQEEGGAGRPRSRSAVAFMRNCFRRVPAPLAMPRAEAGGLRCRRLAVGRLADAAADSDAIYGNQGASIGGAGCIAFTEWSDMAV